MVLSQYGKLQKNINPVRDDKNYNNPKPQKRKSTSTKF
jgi:hypothetical protein